MEANKYPVNVPQELNQELLNIFEETFDVDRIRQRLIEEGYPPPGDDPGWSIAYATGPSGEDLGLVWSPPNYPED